MRYLVCEKISGKVLFNKDTSPFVLKDIKNKFKDYDVIVGYFPDETTHIIDGKPITIIDTATITVSDFILAIQNKLDNTAQSRGYDGIVSLCSYATSTDSVFGVEGRAGVAWRDAVWRKGNAIRSEVESGNRSMPTIEELLLELPEMLWE